MDAALAAAAALIVPPGSLVYIPASAVGEVGRANSWQASQAAVCAAWCSLASPASLVAPLRCLPPSPASFKLLKIANKINEEQKSHELAALPVQNVAFDLRLQLLEAVK